MPEFLSPTDIGSRAAQLCGQPQLDPTLGFADPSSKASAEIGFVYDKLRKAELQRNTWRFAIRLAALRPIDGNTVLIAPALWVSSTTYFKGSLVSDQNGLIWQSTIPNNTGNQPGTLNNFTVWVPYFGPLTVSLYDSTVSYYSGEVVYTTAGNGTYNVFSSLQNSNALHPALPDQWLISAAFYKNQVVQRFPNWAVGTTYAQGNGVLYTDGNVYVSLTNSNVGNAPSSSASNWQLMPFLQLATPVVPSTGTQPTFSPTTSPISEWSNSAGYSIGSFVIFNATVYMSLANNNTANYPNASGSTSWIAVSNGATYMSLIDFNIGNDPANSPALWLISTTYASGAKVCGSDGIIYTSNSNGNLGHDPTLDATHTFWTNTGTLCPWTTVFTLGSGNEYWIQIGGTAFPSGVALQTLDIVWPVGAGPLSQSTTRNVFRLPANFLRKAPRDSKAGIFSPLGAPGNLNADDWEFRGNYITSWEATAIMFPFVADMQDVSDFDSMFCEGLACRCALAVVESLTNSTAKNQMIAGEYQKFMNEARLSNAILIGSEEPALDDWIACRV